MQGYTCLSIIKVLRDVKHGRAQLVYSFLLVSAFDPELELLRQMPDGVGAGIQRVLVVVLVIEDAGVRLDAKCIWGSAGQFFDVGASFNGNIDLFEVASCLGTQFDFIKYDLILV